MVDLWVLKDVGPEWEIDHPASPLEVVEAARQHVDYEAAAEAAYTVLHTYRFEDPKIIARGIIDAALGIEGEEGT